MPNKPKNDFEALVLALVLSVTAKTDEHSKECIEMADSIALNLTELEVARAKHQAEKNIKELEGN